MDYFIAVLFEFREHVRICSHADRRCLRKYSRFGNIVVYCLREYIFLVRVVLISEKDLERGDRYIILFNEFG